MIGSVILASSTSPTFWTRLLRVLSLSDYNTRIVILGTMVLGIACGVSGTYMLLRRRALIGDVLSHATLPGIVIAFLVMTAMGLSGKSLVGLLIGGAAAGAVAVALVGAVRRLPRINEDAALGLVLSTMFGLGIALLSIVQKLPTGNQAGLESFLYGKTASMVLTDVIWMSIAAGGTVVGAILFEKEFAVLSFDAPFARAQGWPTGLLDALMMTMVTVVIVIGLQAVGLILVIAILIIPPASARFWTHRLRTMLIVSAFLGGLSGMVGAAASAVAPRLPAGAMIVVVAACGFAISMCFGPRGGLIPRAIEFHGLKRRTARQHLMRALFEYKETRGLNVMMIQAIPIQTLVDARAWDSGELERAIRSAGRRSFITRPDHAHVQLTDEGLRVAARIVRNHRLWEMYLITHADIAPSHVDRDADEIEHILAPDMIERLERLLENVESMPPSPHVLDVASSEVRS